MREIACPRCGAVFVSQGSSQPCTHCGTEVLVRVAMFRSFFQRFSWRILQYSLVVAYAVITLGIRDWRIFAAASLILMGGLLWAFFLRDGRGGLLDPIAALNLGRRELKNSDHVAPQFGPPEMPRRWQSLVSLPAPRNVYLGNKTKVAFSLLWLVILANDGFVLQKLSARGTKHIGSFMLSLVVIYAILPFWITITSLWREWSAREVLRDGRITIGYWGDESYQFWTRSGRRFEHKGAIVSPEEDVLTSTGLVPVFYLSDNPAKSVALCCVRSRVRMPSIETIRQSGDWRSHKAES
jgi:hypothetical protein